MNTDSRQVASTPACRWASRSRQRFLIGIAMAVWLVILPPVCIVAAAEDRHHDRRDHEKSREQPFNNDSRVIDPKTGETRAIIRQDRFDGHYDVIDPKTGETKGRVNRDCFLQHCK